MDLALEGMTVRLLPSQFLLGAAQTVCCGTEIVHELRHEVRRFFRKALIVPERRQSRLQCWRRSHRGQMIRPTKLLRLCVGVCAHPRHTSTPLSPRSRRIE